MTRLDTRCSGSVGTNWNRERERLHDETIDTCNTEAIEVDIMYTLDN